MRKFEIDDLDMNIIEFEKIIGRVGNTKIKNYQIGYLNDENDTPVYDFKKYIEDNNYRVFRKFPVYPYILHEFAFELFDNISGMEIVGYYVNRDRYIERVYNFESEIEKRKEIIYDEELHENLFLVDERQYNLLPKNIIYVEFHSYELTLRGINKLYVVRNYLNPKNIGKNVFKCHINKIGSLKAWILKQNLKYEHENTILGLDENKHLIFDLNHELWSSIKMKILFEKEKFL